MWISVVPAETHRADVLLPRKVWPQARSRAWIKFGLHHTQVTLGVVEGARGGTGSTPESPVEIYINKTTLQELRIRPEPVYRLRVLRGGRLEIGPVLGLLLGDRNHWYHHDYLFRDAERVTIPYRETGGLYCAFSPRSFSMARKRAYGLWYHPQRRRWCFGELPLPPVLHRRSFANTAQQALHRLLAVPGLTVFNAHRFDKWETYLLFQKDGVLRRHTPATELVDGVDGVIRHISRWGTVILKPVDLSRGRGIVIARRAAAGPFFTVMDFRVRDRPRQRQLSRDGLAALIRDLLAERQYICQQKISLATFHGNPFDIRVVMQKGPGGAWWCGGIECRVARSGSLITNLSMGG